MNKQIKSIREVGWSSVVRSMGKKQFGQTNKQKTAFIQILRTQNFCFGQ